MPAYRLLAGSTDIGQYDVIGVDSESEAEFIRHVALSAIAVPGYNPTNSLTVTHMGPPFGVGDKSPAHAVGVLPLNEDEQESIRLFINELRIEYLAAVERLRGRYRDSGKATRYVELAQYCIHPHSSPFSRLIGDGTVQLRQFSCAGFIIEAYQEAGIDLLITDETRLPTIDIDMLCAAYSDYATELRDPDFREKKNLQNDGPWPVVLAGYLINALASVDQAAANPRSSLPYQPLPGDGFFPPRRPIKRPVTK